MLYVFRSQNLGFVRVRPKIFRSPDKIMTIPKIMMRHRGQPHSITKVNMTQKQYYKIVPRVQFEGCVASPYQLTLPTPKESNSMCIVDR